MAKRKLCEGCMDCSRAGAKFPYCDQQTLEQFDYRLAEFAGRYLPRTLPDAFDHTATKLAAAALLDSVTGWPVPSPDGGMRQVFIREGWRRQVLGWGKNDGLPSAHFARLTDDHGDVISPQLHPYADSLRNACSALAAYAVGGHHAPPHVLWAELQREVYQHLVYVGLPVRPVGWWIDELFRDKRAKLLHLLIAGEPVSRKRLMTELQYQGKPSDDDTFHTLLTRTNADLNSRDKLIGEQLEIAAHRVEGQPGHILRAIRRPPAE